MFLTSIVVRVSSLGDKGQALYWDCGISLSYSPVCLFSSPDRSNSRTCKFHTAHTYMLPGIFDIFTHHVNYNKVMNW